jgi:hypothetical protein
MRRMSVLFLIVAAAGLAACGARAPGIDEGSPPPPADESEGLVEVDTDEGLAAAELTAQPDEVEPGEAVSVRVENRGELTVSFGRPIVVERWDGQDWTETDESREAAWTMELLLLDPGQPGVEQIWPFLDDHTPEPGWYRFTKRLHAETAEGDPAELVIRARVRVAG